MRLSHVICDQLVVAERFNEVIVTDDAHYMAKSMWTPKTSHSKTMKVYLLL